jgi:hypothetical protein
MSLMLMKDENWAKRRRDAKLRDLLTSNSSEEEENEEKKQKEPVFVEGAAPITKM